MVPDHLQFMQDASLYNLPIQGHRRNGKNTYDLVALAVSLIVGELRECGLSLSSCGSLLGRIDLDELSHCTAKLHLDEIDELIVLVPQRDDLDEEFQKVVTSWDSVRHFGKDENINFIPVPIHDLLKAKIKNEW